jgi:hypothetical protein
MFKPMEDRVATPAPLVHPSLDGFIAWLETKNPKETYNWHNCDNCAVGQYLNDTIGVTRHNNRAKWKEIWPHVLNQIAYSAGPRTFGSLLEMAKASVPKL